MFPPPLFGIAVLSTLLGTGCSLLIEPGENAGNGGPGGDADCVDQEVTVSGDDYDGEVYGGMVYDQGEYSEAAGYNRLYLGSWQEGVAWGYFRFALPVAFHPSHLDGRIRLRLWGEGDLSWNDENDNLQIVLEDTASAGPVTDPNRAPTGSADPMLVTQWPSTGSGLDWDDGRYNESPDLAASFRQLNQSYDLQPGQLVQLWVGRFTDAGESEVITPDSSQTDQNWAKLRFECPGSETDN